MQTNATPVYDASDNPTKCCPRFNPAGWDGQELHFENKPFCRARTRSLFHIPIDMAAVFKRTFRAIEAAHGHEKQFIVLTRDVSAWTGEHLFAVSRPVPGGEMAALDGDYRTKVFEGPFRDVPKWERQLKREFAARGETIYFFYTTCPNCAKSYGKNYVVAVAERTQ